MTLRLSWPLGAFLSFATAAYLVGALVVVPALASVPRPDVLATALAVDLVGLVPLAWAGVIYARGGRWATLAPAVGLSALGAWLVLPPDHHGVLAPLASALPLVEIGVLAVVVITLVRRFRAEPTDAPVSDVVERIQSATARALGEGAASRAAAYEIAVLRYALGPRVAPEADGFAYRRSSGYGALLAGVAVAGAVELVGGHLLVRHFWGDVAALVHLGLSGYALLWLAGDWRALGARPVLLRDGVLRIRCGLRWRVDVPLDAVASVHHVRGALPTDRPLLDASVLRNARLLLDLREPVVADGPYGLRREIERVAFAVDEPERFLDALAEALRSASGNAWDR